MSRFGILNILYIAGVAFLALLIIYGAASYITLIIFAISYLLILTAGIMSVSFEFFMEIENNGDARFNEIAISFDDGPNTEFTPKVLDKLDQYNVKAAFFCIGKNIVANPKLINDIHNRGHLIGNHSFNHENHFPILSTSKIKKELEDVNQKITDIIGFTPRFFRPPFGVTNPRIASAVKELDLTAVGWSLRTLDTAKSPTKVIRKIKNKLTGGDLILLHDNNEGILEILDFLIPFAKENGLKIVRADKLIKKEAYGIQL